MTITQMECFVEAVHTGSFSKAGTRLFISQQTVSRQIKALEDELGFPLFERHRDGVVLTEQGKLMHDVWEKLLAENRNAIDKAKDSYYGESKVIRIGVFEFGRFRDKVIQALLKFNEKYPDLYIEYERMSMETMEEWFQNGKIDMMIVAESEIENKKSLKMLPLIENFMKTGIVVSEHHPLLRQYKNQISCEAIQNEQIGVLSKHVSRDHQKRVEDEFVRNGITKPLSMREYGTMQSIQMALITEKCVTIMFDYILDGIEDKVLFFPIHEPKDLGRMVLCWKDDKFNVKAKNLAKIFEEQ